MFSPLQLDAESGDPLYRQLYTKIKELIVSGRLARGERLPATRELAGSLGLNRATVSAAYSLLESDGLIQGHVGRGSFVAGDASESASLNWADLLPPPDAVPPSPPGTAEMISFASSRPAEDLFPLDVVRDTCTEVLAGPEAAGILQLGSPAGYAPLRRYLVDEARKESVARQTDDLMVTNGCQQGLDLVCRVLVRPGDTVVVEDPVYPGLKNVFAKAGAQLVGVPVSAEGVDVEEFERAMARGRPRLAVLTPNFQNPTGTTLRKEARHAVLRAVRAAGAVLVENDIYGALSYEEDAPAPIKQIDDGGNTVLLRSFSKLTFPGLRVGWVIGPKPLVARLTEAKQLADLHTDHLSQAVLLRFAESGRLALHRERVLAAGRERLRAVVGACEAFLPRGTQFTRPRGGMNMWVRLPEPLDSSELLARAHRAGVSYLPGRYFEVSRRDPGGLRLSFAGLAPGMIRKGIESLGRIFGEELARVRVETYEPAPAVV